MEKIFQNYYPKFVENIISKINKLDDFILVFNLFPPKLNLKINKKIIDIINNYLWKTIEKEENIENSEKFNEIMMNISLMLANGNYRYEEFLNQLNSKGIKKEKMKDFYLWLITYYGETNKEIIPYSIKFLCSDKSDSNIEDIVNILNQLRNNLDALLSYFNSQNIIQKVIKEENDFKKSNLTTNFKFLKLLVENDFFEENN